jgi:PAS domain S-box-containing protein
MEGDSAIKALQSEIHHLKSDISKQKEYEGHLEHLLFMVSEGLMMIGKDGRITYVNKALEQMVGCQSAEMIGERYDDARWSFQCLPDMQGLPQEPVFKNVFETGDDLTDKICRMEFEKGKSRIFTVNATVHHDPQGNMAGVAAIIRDSTELSLVKAENIEIKNVYERLAQHADEAIFRILTASGRMVYINEAAEKILDYSLDDYLSDSSIQEKVISMNHLRNWINAMGRTGGKDVLKNIVMECSSRDGRTVILEFTVIAVRDAEGGVVYFECLGRDVTVRRFMEAELARAQKLESIGLLAGGIAHDFNNILTAIFGSLALAKMDSMPDSPVFTRLSGAEEHCMKAKALTRKLLTYSRGGSPQRKTASIANVIRDAVTFTLSGKNIDCRFDLPEGLWAAQIDEGQMHQVVHSLVSNACEAMPQGGSIEVGAENAKLTKEQIPSLACGHYVKWYVRDHGVGISQEHMKKIFDPYFTTKQMGSVKGMGLGLAICYSIVKSHEGVITVESSPGIGTTFTVYIPASNGEKTESKPAALKETPAAQMQKVLLVDDEQILLDVTGSMLKHLGYDVTMAKNHGDAMESYSRAKQEGTPFSLIIMDLTMRGDEGGEIAIRRWKTSHPEVKAVISSGYMNDPVIEEYWKYGFVGAMVKPYSLIELKNSLEKILAGIGN